MAYAEGIYEIPKQKSYHLLASMELLEAQGSLDFWGLKKSNKVEGIIKYNRNLNVEKKLVDI